MIEAAGPSADLLDRYLSSFAHDVGSHARVADPGELLHQQQMGANTLTGVYSTLDAATTTAAASLQQLPVPSRSPSIASCHPWLSVQTPLQPLSGRGVFHELRKADEAALDAATAAQAQQQLLQRWALPTPEDGTAASVRALAAHAARTVRLQQLQDSLESRAHRQRLMHQLRSPHSLFGPGTTTSHPEFRDVRVALPAMSAQPSDSLPSPRAAELTCTTPRPMQRPHSRAGSVVGQPRAAAVMRPPSAAAAVQESLQELMELRSRYCKQQPQTQPRTALPVYSKILQQPGALPMPSTEPPAARSISSTVHPLPPSAAPTALVASPLQQRRQLISQQQQQQRRPGISQQQQQQRPQSAPPRQPRAWDLLPLRSSLPTGGWQALMTAHRPHCSSAQREPRAARATAARMSVQQYEQQRPATAGGCQGAWATHVLPSHVPAQLAGQCCYSGGSAPAVSVGQSSCPQHPCQQLTAANKGSRASGTAAAVSSGNVSALASALAAARAEAVSMAADAAAALMSCAADGTRRERQLGSRQRSRCHSLTPAASLGCASSNKVNAEDYSSDSDSGSGSYTSCQELDCSNSSSDGGGAAKRAKHAPQHKSADLQAEYSAALARVRTAAAAAANPTARLLQSRRR
jgi:hypothetical protein